MTFQFDKQGVQALTFLHIDFQGAVFVKTATEAVQFRRGIHQLFCIQNKGFHVQLLQQFPLAGVPDNLAVVDNGDVTAQGFRLFEVMGGQDNGGALAVHLFQELPHRAP